MIEKEYIEREVLIKQFETLKEKAETLRDVVYLESILAVIYTTPTADVQEVRHGKWIEYDNGIQTCSECGYMTEDCTEKKYSQDGDYCYLCEYEYKFCPNCGAKMDKESESK